MGVKSLLSVAFQSTIEIRRSKCSLERAKEQDIQIIDLSVISSVKFFSSSFTSTLTFAIFSRIKRKIQQLQFDMSKGWQTLQKPVLSDHFRYKNRYTDIMKEKERKKERERVGSTCLV